MELFIPQGTNGLNYYFFLTVRQPCYQGSNDIFPLQQSPCRWVILNKIRYGHTSPFSVCRVRTLHLQVPNALQRGKVNEEYYVRIRLNLLDYG